MTQSIEIKKYMYYLFSSREDASPVIYLYDKHNTHIGYVYFKSDGNPLDAAKVFSNGKYALFFRRSLFTDVIDMLRNESPVYLHYVPEGENNTRLSTSPEPVGEKET